MSKTVKAIAAAALLGTGTMLGSTAAEARVSDGAAVGIGVLGLGLGAAIASDHSRYYGGGGGYYRERYYAPAPVYYAPPRYYHGYPGYYRGGYYGRGYYGRCRVVDRWDPYWGGYRPVRRCW